MLTKYLFLGIALNAECTVPLDGKSSRACIDPHAVCIKDGITFKCKCEDTNFNNGFFCKERK